MAFLNLLGICKSFSATLPVLQGLDLEVEAGEIVCLLGASGSGKTTLLRLLAGLEDADAGEMHLIGKDIQGLASHERRIGFMFQEHVLFPHMNVGANIAYGLRRQGWGRSSIHKRVEELLELIRMPDFHEREIQELSGGESQRVALARSLAPNPRLLLLDEPLASLDRKLREELVQEVKRLLRQLSMTALYVTHDQEEAYVIADRIALLHDGRIIQIGTPQDLYFNPESAFAARFLRMKNLFPCTGPEIGSLPSWLRQPFDFHGQKAFVLIRPDALSVQPNRGGPGRLEVPVKIRDLTFRGRYYELQVDALDCPSNPETSWPMTLELPAASENPILAAVLSSDIPGSDILIIQLDKSRIQFLLA